MSDQRKKWLRQLALSGLLNAGGAAPIYTISGTVYDADGTTPVEGATVALGALSAVSAADGTYTISDVPPGTSGSMTCTKAGYSWTAISVAAMSGNLTGQNYTNAWWAGGGSAAGIVAAYQPIAEDTYETSMINVANPGTFDLATVFGKEPSFVLGTGLVFDGVDDYLRTGITPASGWSFLVWFTDATGGTAAVHVPIGSVKANARFCFSNDWAVGGTYAYQSGGVVSDGANTRVSSGVVAVANQQGYLNGVANLGAIAAWSDTSVEMYFGAGNNNGSVNFWLKGAVKAAAIWNVSLTPTQVAQVTAGVQL